MNVYDFDKTIYKNDSTTDFFLFSLKRHPKIIITIPRMAFSFLKFYVLKIGTKTQFKEGLYKFLKYIDVDKEIQIFWKRNQKLVKRFYLNQQKEDDVIISASPEFVIKPICKILGIKYVMASKVDKKTGIYDGVNCHGEEKVRRFYEKFPNASIDKFYSDSHSDTPLAKLAKKAFIVKDENISDWIFH